MFGRLELVERVIVGGESVSDVLIDRPEEGVVLAGSGFLGRLGSRDSPFDDSGIDLISGAIVVFDGLDLPMHSQGSEQVLGELVVDLFIELCGVARRLFAPGRSELEETTKPGSDRDVESRIAIAGKAGLIGGKHDGCGEHSLVTSETPGLLEVGE